MLPEYFWILIAGGTVWYVVLYFVGHYFGEKWFPRGLTESEKLLAERLRIAEAELARTKTLVDLLSDQLRQESREKLAAHVRSERRDDTIRAQGVELERMRKELETAWKDIATLRTQLEAKKIILPVPPPPPPAILLPMGVICGEPEFCADDMEQLARARIWHRAIQGPKGEAATGDEVTEEIQRRRHDGTLYKWLLISSHGTHRGIHLRDGIKPREWWQPVLEGVKVVMLANCEGQATGDVIAGLVDRVVLFYGDRNSVDMSAFVYSFFRELAIDDNADRAFQVAIAEVPSIKRWVDIRRR